MTASYRIFPDLKIKYVQVSGYTDLRELKTLAKRFFEDPEFSPELRQIIDLSELTDASSRFIEVFTLRNFYLRNYGKLERPVSVFIIAPTELGESISKMFSFLMFGQRVMDVQIYKAHQEIFEALSLSYEEQTRVRSRYEGCASPSQA